MLKQIDVAQSLLPINKKGLELDPNSDASGNENSQSVVKETKPPLKDHAIGTFFEKKAQTAWTRGDWIFPKIMQNLPENSEAYRNITDDINENNDDTKD